MEFSRRNFIRRVGMASLGLGFGIYVFPRILVPAQAQPSDKAHDLRMQGAVNFEGFIAKEVTPNSEFYITSYSDTVPEVDPEAFRLRIEGLVEKPYSLSLKELTELQDKSAYVTLECIGNPVGGNAISNALWEGVTLKRVLAKAVPKPGIVKAAFFAAEGYTDSIPYDLALSEDVFLAFRMNGQPLPPKHGYPLRVVVPGIFGMKNVKWLSKIELVNYDFKGYWEKTGWSDTAVIPLMSEILMPMDGNQIPFGQYVMGGIAFGGRHGVSRVQISVDGGSWQDADLKRPLSKWAWTLWRYAWTPVHEGDFTLRVRAFDRQGKTQESSSLLGDVLGSYPDGARGIQSLQVNVGKR
jgi:DMSO/TMAO reductase YedYZ molybdopterin-dependent catalytic subunit